MTLGRRTVTVSIYHYKQLAYYLKVSYQLCNCLANTWSTLKTVYLMGRKHHWLVVCLSISRESTLFDMSTLLPGNAGLKYLQVLNLCLKATRCYFVLECLEWAGNYHATMHKLGSIYHVTTAPSQPWSSRFNPDAVTYKAKWVRNRHIYIYIN